MAAFRNNVGITAPKLKLFTIWLFKKKLAVYLGEVQTRKEMQAFLFPQYIY